MAAEEPDDQQGTPAPPERRRNHRLELLETFLMAVAAVLTAWAAFQSTKWGGVQADSYSRAAAARFESNREANAAGQQRIIDTEMFTAWVDAVADERRAGREPDVGPDGVYDPDPNRQSGFVFERFRDRFRIVTREWLATYPLINPDAPSSPFVMPDYEIAADQRAVDLEANAERLSERAREANQNGDNYVLMTIVFATVLVFAGFSSKMETDRIRLALVGMAATTLVVATIVVTTFPKKV